MKQFFLISILSFLIIQTGKSQESRVLDNYIRLGLENNLALKQKRLQLEKSIYALKEANGLFYPSVELNSQYILASGGRSIDLPIGDLFNPVYSSLNELLDQPGRFPQIKNQKIQFLPNDYHDTKLRVVLPLVNAEIYYNRKIKNELISFSQAELNVFKRELVKEIKIAYLRYLQATSVIEAYRSDAGLIMEAIHVNEKLVKNEMAGNEKVLRFKADLSNVEAQVYKAENDKKTASAYFNFLINQPLNNEIALDSSLLEGEGKLFEEFGNEVNNREELVQLKSAVNASGLFLNMKKSYWLPGINNITDMGYQGYQLKFNNDQQYVMNVIELKWNIFNGFQNRNKISQAKIEKSTWENRLSETELQIELQQQTALNNYNSSIMTERASQSSLLSSGEYYKIISRQYSEGQKTMLDLLDARNQLTNSRINCSVSHFETLIKLAELERVMAGYKIE